MQINSVIMAGRLTNNVKYGSTKDGTPLSTFRLANNRGDDTNYFRIASFGKVADYAYKYLKKSERVTVQGSMDHYEKKNKDGSYNDYYTIIANTFDPVHLHHQSKSERQLYAKLGNLTKKVDRISEQSNKNVKRSVKHE